MRICIPVRGANFRDTAKLFYRAEKAGDLVEIWLDKDAGLIDLIRRAKKPVIAVCRGKSEGGSFYGSENERFEILRRAAAAGAEFVDMDLDMNKKFIHESKLIISKHFWDETPDIGELMKTYRKAKKLGADIVKIATKINRWSDNAVLFELTRRVTENGCKIIAVGMGEKGKISRIGCPFLGSYLTYIALDEKTMTAEGQLTMKDLKFIK